MMEMQSNQDGPAGVRKPVSDIAFTPAVKRIQEAKGSRNSYVKRESMGGWNDQVTPQLESFIAERDSFYLATATADGQPYIQHRGGPPGFLKVLDERTVAFADYRGNRQYISIGNLSENDRAFVFLMDYADQTRIKIWGRAEVVEDDATLLQQVSDPDYKATPQRVIILHVEAWDVNCNLHITRRFTEEQVEERIADLRARIDELEAQR